MMKFQFKIKCYKNSLNIKLHFVTFELVLLSVTYKTNEGDLWKFFTICLETLD